MGQRLLHVGLIVVLSLLFVSISSAATDTATAIYIDVDDRRTERFRDEHGDTAEYNDVVIKIDGIEYKMTLSEFKRRIKNEIPKKKCINCVPPDIAVNAWSDAVSRMDRPLVGLTFSTIECDPCKCPINGMSCYEFMASREREKEKEYKKAIELLERAKIYGICR